MKGLVLVNIFCLSMLTCLFTNAQDISFNKKNGEFKAGDVLVARLESEKVKSIGKNYILKDASGAHELIAYRLHSWQDTFGGPTEYYYSIHSTPFGFEAFRPNFTGSLNTFKEVGEHIIEKGLLQPDGKLSEANTKAYFQAQVSEGKNYPQAHLVRNDSLMKLVNVPAEPVERDMRKAIIANQYGKIGQGNVVIGSWEYLETPAKAFNETATHLFVIRNINGGIVSVSWIELSGAHTYVFKNGVRSRENWTVPDFVNNNPISNKEQYVAKLAAVLTKAGLL